MINIHDREGNLVMHVDSVNGVYVGPAFEPRYMAGELHSSSATPRLQSFMDSIEQKNCGMPYPQQRPAAKTQTKLISIME